MKLFIPGPVAVSEEIMEEMGRPMIGHRSKEFQELFRNIVNDLKYILNTENDVFILTSSATGGMEAAVKNTVNRKVLCLSNGEFGRRWAEIARLSGKEVTELDFGDGKPFDTSLVKEELGKGYEALTVVINETSTGIENNIEEIKELLHEHPQTLLLADGVTAVFGTRVAPEGIHVLLFGTQKALALPPGLCVIIADKAAMERVLQVKNRGYYFDFMENKRSAEKGFTLTTPNIPLMYGLRAQLRNIKHTGIEAWIRRHERNAMITREFLEERGFEMFIDQNNMSKTVTVVVNNMGLDTSEMITVLKNQGFEIANGYGKLAGKTFRIGHMGVSERDTKVLLERIDAYLADRTCFLKATAN
ncbi:MAG: alanine--glyoxylate aminotransferase family protein [Candidatus Aenigmarchaeota archaeon]|nr:alanine--glyoxylate aminotransferase family protein [Candidatus Aenigmarchaeota archaeon]